ncbi:MAG: Rap1a/Tai family immunity protein [Steroidobacteraceae bacterium]
MKLPVTAAGVLLLASVAPQPSTSMEWLSDSELEASCDAFLSDTEDAVGALCLAFMQGFLAGADATASFDSASETSKSESFSERASRTRLGSLRMLQIRSSTTAGYCIGEDVAAVDIIGTVAAYLRDHPETLSLSNADAIREALVDNYPCDD